MNSIQQRNLLLFIGGRLISLIGSGIQMIAIPLFILDYTGSGTLMGVFTMLCMIPMLLVAPLAGVLGDRWNRKGIAVYKG
jgi:MFS transporter, DHA3 family, macrolide efflux protein